MNNEEIIFAQGTLSEEDINVCSGMMVVFLHAAEKMMRLMELHYEAEYRAGKEYKQYCKILGKAKTDEVMGKQIRKIVRGDERNRLGRLLKIAKDFHSTMERLTDNAMHAHKDNTTDTEAFDAIMHDVNFIAYLYALTGNCHGKDDEIKIISTVKAFAKGGRISDNLLNKLFYNINL